MSKGNLRLVPTPDREEEHEELCFDDLFRRFAPYVGAIGMRLLGRSHEVEDLVQDVFLEAYRSRHKLIAVAPAKGWLAIVAVRKSQRRLRARRMRTVLGLDTDHDYSTACAPGLSPEEQVQLGEIFTALDRIPTSARVAWCLRYLHGEQLTAVAQLCDCSLATAKRRIARAHNALLSGGYYG